LLLFHPLDAHGKSNVREFFAPRLLILFDSNAILRSHSPIEKRNILFHQFDNPVVVFGVSITYTPALHDFQF
jgi:hypothetical protein